MKYEDGSDLGIDSETKRSKENTTITKTVGKKKKADGSSSQRLWRSAKNVTPKEKCILITNKKVLHAETKSFVRKTTINYIIYQDKRTEEEINEEKHRNKEDKKKRRDPRNVE